MGSITKHIPNSITCLNLLTGCFAVKYAFDGDYEMVLYLTFLAAIFDFMDGLCARLLHAYSDIGKELDSLADMVSFGLVPAIAVYTFMDRWISGFEEYSQWWSYAPYFAFIIAVASGLRLAKFNVDPRQTINFIGMPTPANTLFWIPLIYTISAISDQLSISFGYIIIVGVCVMSYLLVCEIPMLSLKFKSFSMSLPNIIRISLVLITLVLTLLFGMLGISLGILTYVVFSIVMDTIEHLSN